MNKRVWILASMAVLLVALATSAQAMPSLAGPTGIVTVPNAAIAPTNDLQVALSYQPFEMYAAHSAAAWSLQALRGVSDEAELWVAYSRVQDGADSDAWQLGGKYQVPGDWPADVQVAVGGSVGRWIDAFSIPWVLSTGMYTTDVDINKLYVVASRSLTKAAPGWTEDSRPTQMIASVGLLYISVDPDRGGHETTARPFVGLEIVQGDSHWGIEYRAKDNDLDDKGVFSAMLRRPAGRDMYMEVGTSNASPIGLGLSDQDFYVRLGYDYPLEVGYY